MTHFLDRTASALTLVSGWRRLGLAGLTGAVSALAQAPFHLSPVLFLTLPTLVFLIDGAVETHRSGRVARLGPAFWVGWWFGFGYFLAGLWWIGGAFLVDIERFGWMLPFAVTAMPAGLAVFYGLATLVARLAWREGIARVLALALAFTAAEWLRGHVQIGYALAAEPLGMQAASVVGVYGMTMLAMLVFSAPVAWQAEARDRRQTRPYAIAAIALVAVIAVHGAVRLHLNPTVMHPDIALRLVQPSQDEQLKWQPETQAKVLERLLDLSDRPTSPERTGLADVTHLLWPESPFPYLLAREPGALARIAAALPPNTTLITGANRAEAPAPGENRPRFFNTLYVIGADGQIEASYDKAHLVPFGEYVPLSDAMASMGLGALAGLAGGFEAGPGLRTLNLRGAPRFTPLICYEIVFPGAAVPENDRPGWIVNVTNDGWFGDTPGPRQHFHQARLRAVEEGLPVVRVANNGISAIVDPLGRVVARLDVNVIGVLDGELPLAAQPTVYALLGDWVVVALSVTIFLILVGILIYRSRQPTLT
jgi:apolipoprotein N-acyltransferase